MGIVTPDPKNIRHSNEPVSNNEGESSNPRSSCFWGGNRVNNRCRRNRKGISKVSRESS